MKDFEDREDDLSAAKGCYNGFRYSLIFWGIILIIYFSCSGCTMQPIITKDKGKVIDLSAIWVEVSYEVVNRPDQRHAANIYHKPCGHQYNIGDSYPDQKKELPCGL